MRGLAQQPVNNGPPGAVSLPQAKHFQAMFLAAFRLASVRICRPGAGPRLREAIGMTDVSVTGIRLRRATRSNTYHPISFGFCLVMGVLRRAGSKNASGNEIPCHTACAEANVHWALYDNYAARLTESTTRRLSTRPQSRWNQNKQSCPLVPQRTVGRSV
jgi:hypothetical protein